MELDKDCGQNTDKWARRLGASGKRLGLLLVLSLLIGLFLQPALAFDPQTGPSGDKPLELIARGEGLDRLSAEKDAKRNAIEQVVGVYIKASTEVKNYQLVEDKIQTHSQGFIKRMQIIDEGQTGDIYWIRIRAEVTAEIHRALKNTFEAMHLQLRELGSPSVAVVIKESDGLMPPQHLQEEIQAQLAQQGYPYANLEQALKNLRDDRRQQIQALLESHPDEPRVTLVSQGGETIVLPQSQLTNQMIQIINEQYDATFYTIFVQFQRSSPSEARLSAEIVENATGRGVGASVEKFTLSAAKPQEFKREFDQALQRLFRQPEKGLSELMYRYLESDKQNGLTLKLIITNYNRHCGKALRQILKSESQNYRRDTLGGGSASYTVWVKDLTHFTETLEDELSESQCLHEKLDTSMVSRQNRLLLRFKGN